MYNNIEHSCTISCFVIFCYEFFEGFAYHCKLNPSYPSAIPQGPDFGTNTLDSLASSLRRFRADPEEIMAFLLQ